MELIKRNALVIRAKYPVLEWIHSIAELELDEITLEEINEDATVLLIPEFETDAEVDAYLQDGKVFLLEQELENWTEEQDVWPRPRTPALFDEWFEVVYHSMVWDTVDDEDEDEDDNNNNHMENGA